MKDLKEKAEKFLKGTDTSYLTRREFVDELAFAHVMNDGWKPDWESAFQVKFKYGIKFIENALVIGDYLTFNGFIFGIAVKSKEIAEQMLEKFGDRIKKFYNEQY